MNFEKNISESFSSKVVWRYPYRPRYSEVNPKWTIPWEFFLLWKKAWLSVIKVKRNFLVKHRSENCKDDVQEMLSSFKENNVKMYLKEHFMVSNSDFFPLDLSRFSDQHGERFHQTIKVAEERYNGWTDPAMLAEDMN